MEYLPQKPYLRLLVIIFYLALAALLTFVFIKYLAPALMPFIIAWILALLIYPVIDKLHRRTKLPKGILSTVLIVLILAFIVFVVYCVCVQIYTETSKFIVSLAEADNGSAFIERLTERFPFIKSITENETVIKIYNRIAEYGSDTLNSVTSTILSKVTNFLSAFITALPNTVVFLAVTLIAAVYFCSDFKNINRYIGTFLPSRLRIFTIDAKNEFTRTVSKYIKAYLILMGITFVEIFAGFLILKIDYAFIFAVAIAILDILPVIGTGTFLIPAAIYFILINDFYRGFGIAILYIIISIIRQIAEPKVVGKSLGLHPLVSLMAIYAGYKLIGFAGIFIMPIIIIILKNLADSGKIGFGRKKQTETPR